MRYASAVCFVAALLFGSAIEAKAQDSGSRSLASLRDKVTQAISEKMPGWAHKEVTPMEGSDSTIIYNWESGDVVIKVAITQHASQAEAVESLKDFRCHMETEERAAKARGRHKFKRVMEELPELGDSGFAWDSYGSTAASFRKHKFTVSISMVRSDSNQTSDVTKDFARLIAATLPKQ